MICERCEEKEKLIVSVLRGKILYHELSALAMIFDSWKCQKYQRTSFVLIQYYSEEIITAKELEEAFNVKSMILITIQTDSARWIVKPSKEIRLKITQQFNFFNCNTMNSNRSQWNKAKTIARWARHENQFDIDVMKIPLFCLYDQFTTCHPELRSDSADIAARRCRLIKHPFLHPFSPSV